MNIFRKNIKKYLSDLRILRENNKRCTILWDKNLIRLFNSDTQQGNQNIKDLYVILNHQKTQPVVRLKIVMLLHTFIYNSNKNYKWISQNDIENFILQKSKNNQQQNPTRWLSKIVMIYARYIKKICANSELYEQTKKIKVYQIKIQCLIEKAYLLINLIKSIFPLKEYILNFGRYFFQYQIIIDLNSIIAKDLATIYNYYSSVLAKIKKDCFQNLTKQQLEQFSSIIDQTFLMHQQLYLFFYNRYYYDKIQFKTLNWFEYQNKQYDILSKQLSGKKSKKQKQKYVQCQKIDISSFQETYFQKSKRAQELIMQI